jgi:hypothetical protein
VDSAPVIVTLVGPLVESVGSTVVDTLLPVVVGDVADESVPESMRRHIPSRHTSGSSQPPPSVQGHSRLPTGQSAPVVEHPIPEHPKANSNALRTEPS